MNRPLHLAHLSGDETLTRLFQEGVDVHGETAHSLNIDRDSAKQVNFGICFGISAGRLAGRISQVRREQGLPPVDQATAQTYIDHFDARYPGVKGFFETEWDRMKNRPKSERVVKSLLGRIRRFDTTASRPVERKFRVTWPQQIEADLIKTAMVRLDRIFKRRKMGSRIVMMIHDALWVEAPQEEATEVRHLMKRMMTTAAKLTVPLEVDFK
ncbi:MAG TPA: DNA polymerase [Desulfomonilaceae bacterium]|nr:DNA polymerase [Desulfomonilaceae bacterium]